MLALDLQRRVIQTESTLKCEEDLHHLVLGAHKSHSSSRWLLVTPRIQPNDHLVYETSITRVKEVSEILTEFIENEVDDFSLDSGSELLVEVEILNQHVVVILESLFDILRYAYVQVGWKIEIADRRVGLLYLVDPDIELVCFDHEHALEIDLRSDQWRNLNRKKRKEDETTEFQQDREDVLLAIIPRIVSITDCCQHCVNPIAREDVNLPGTVNLELQVST